jgi:predicted ArsR family transcriptional regulator
MNIRTCDYFVCILEETAAEAYRGFVTYAIDCAADEKSPMHRPTVFFRESGNGLAEFRESLAGRCEVHGYSSEDDLKQGILRMFAEWRDQAKASQAVEAAQTGEASI